jgi:hypothetical protein
MTSIAPSTGTTGTQVAIVGSGLAVVTDVQLGGVSLTNLQATAAQITGVVASHAAGVVDVIAYVGTQTVAMLSKGFTYTAAPGTPGFAFAADLYQGRGLHTATLLNDGRVLIAGGVDAQGTSGVAFVIENELYDPTANTFTPVSMLSGLGGYMVVQDPTQPAGTPFPVARMLHTATLLQNGTVLITGGFGAETIATVGTVTAPVQNDLQTSFIFDPVSNSFAQTGSLNAIREQHYAILQNDGSVLVAGGTDYSQNGGAGQTLGSAELFNPSAPGPTGTLTSAMGAFATITTSVSIAVSQSNMLAPRMAGGAMPLPTGGAVFAGGLARLTGAQVGQPGTPVATYLIGGAECYDPLQQGFSPVYGSLATPLSQPVNDRYWQTLDLTSAGGVMMGGFGGPVTATSLGMVSDIEVLDTTALTWTTVGSLKEGRMHHASAVLLDTTKTPAVASANIVIIGGFNLSAAGAMTTLGDAEYYDGKAKVTEQYQMAQQRNGAVATPLQDGRVLVTGGFQGGTADPFGLDGTSVVGAEAFTKP